MVVFVAGDAVDDGTDDSTLLSDVSPAVSESIGLVSWNRKSSWIMQFIILAQWVLVDVIVSMSNQSAN